MILQVLARIPLIVAGYGVALLAALVTFIVSLSLLAQVFPDNRLLSFLGLGPVLVISLPLVFMFLLVAIAVTSYIAAIAAALASELFGLKRLWQHLVAGVLVGLSMMLQWDSGWLAEMTASRALISAAAFASMLAGGAAYWLIAGGTAGDWQTRFAP